MRSIWTVGHSNHPLEKFLEILKAHRIERVIDVRRFPGSRRWPHFSAAGLSATLPASGIDYAGMPGLGGRRKANPDSPHTAWRVEAFRGYADFMDTPGFAASLERVEALAAEKRSALMCAEALPWRCHRSLIADALIARAGRSSRSSRRRRPARASCPPSPASKEPASSTTSPGRSLSRLIFDLALVVPSVP
jgi:uncharacterized protein (DUF488 family)